VIGILGGVPYPAITLNLGCGDRLVAFSDGVTEAEDPTGHMFGEDRLRETLDACRRQDAAGMVEAVRAAIEGFVGDAPQSDDITLLALSYRPGD
jgi:serine phosphatase RsbU (regulator of sigma subunit)